MTSSFRSLIRSMIPESLYVSLRMNRSRRKSNQWLKSAGVLDLAVQVAERFDYKVQSGPFQGMKYVPAAILSRHATPAMLGVYESEIYPPLAELSSRNDVVIDIGHAEGYYAVGFARLGKTVIAFDADPNERRVCQAMAEANGVTGRLSLHSWCAPENLAELTATRAALIISDIEGGEFELFGSDLIPKLRHCDLVVELHGRNAAENQVLVKRFAETHKIEVVDRSGAIRGTDQLGFLGNDAGRMAAEYRDFQQWLIARAIR